MSHVIVLRGLPASGKSTWTRALVASRPLGEVARINNDDLVAGLFPCSNGRRLDGAGELLQKLRLDLLKRLIKAGIDVIVVDNTNLSAPTVRGLEYAAVEAGATFEVDDRFLAVDVDECVRRDALRPAPVGEAVIRKMARQAGRLKPWVMSAQAFAPVTLDASLPRAVIFDVDGTLAHKHPDRDIYDGSLAHLDMPNPSVVAYAKHLLAVGEVDVVVVTGRDARHRDVTQAWLDEHVAPGLPLFTRAAGDVRRDSIVKREILERDILPNWFPVHAIDDRQQVADQWWASGIPAWLVSREPDF